MAEDAPPGAEHVAVLGRDIRTSSERIARYCIMRHEPIYEDLATLVESMAYWDRLITRNRSTGWARQLHIQIPVYEYGQFRRVDVSAALAEAAWFLTGDRWSFEFVVRKGPAPVRQGKLALPQGMMRHVVSFSDGLDSFAQVQLSIAEHGRDAVMLVRAGLGRDRIFPKVVSLRVPRKFSGVRMREVSYRTRPLVFYTLAAIAAVITKAEAVVIGENGQGAFGPACLPFADEWWFRSAHPAFVKRWADFLGLVLEKPVRFEQPQLWKTKGEVLSELRERGLVAGWEQTSSCATRPKGSLWSSWVRHLWRLPAADSFCSSRRPLFARTGDNAFDVCASEDIVCDRNGRERRMLPSERAVAVRAIATMADFARLADSPQGVSAVDREADLVSPKDPGTVRAKLLRLLQRHRVEWEAFMNSLPKRSWVREIVGQL